jgi:hypothetical protein
MEYRMSRVVVEKLQAPTGKTLQTPSVVSTEKLYNFSGTAYFDTAVNNGYYQPAAYNCYIKRYANIGSATFPPSGSSASSHGLNVASVNAATWCADRELFDVIGGCQLWRVPVTGTYTLTAKGAGRVATYDGRGRSVTCDYKLYAGEWLRIICGAQGETNGSNQVGGHGASCLSVFRQGMHIPILIGAGGAGLSPNSPQSANSNRDARAPQSNYGEGATQGHSSGHYSGREAMGGHGSWYDDAYDSYIETWPGGGGGGWGSPGQGGSIGKNIHERHAGGRALSEICPHGGYYPNGKAYHGGFGGGGATGVSSGGAGGGGGYIGGNGSFAQSTTSDDTNILGGISYCAADSFTDNGTHSTYGQVEVSL